MNEPKDDRVGPAAATFDSDAACTPAPVGNAIPDAQQTHALDPPTRGTPSNTNTWPDGERYEFGPMIGRGGMGMVHRGRDRLLERELAIKVMLPEAARGKEWVRRFFNEARTCGRLQHPGIVPIHEVGKLADGRPYFTMKLVEGRTLAHLLDERASAHADLMRFLKVFEQVCQTVAYAHSMGVIHRDLKPSNIMVGAFGEVQVMDWGLAKNLTPECVGAEDDCETTEPVIPSHPNSELHTRAGAVLGTPGYMPPEQACGEIELLDRRCDVFALGSILCEILTGQPAFAGNRVQVLARTQLGDLSDAVARLAGCGADPGLVQLAKECLSPDRSQRPGDAAAVSAAIAAFEEGVEARLRKAEVERAAAEVRAEAEVAAREAAEEQAEAHVRVLRHAAAEAAESRRRRTAVVVLSVVAFLLLLSLLAVNELWSSRRDSIDYFLRRLAQTNDMDLSGRVFDLRLLVERSRYDDASLSREQIETAKNNISDLRYQARNRSGLNWLLEELDWIEKRLRRPATSR